VAKGVVGCATAVGAAWLLGWLPSVDALRCASVPPAIYGVPACAKELELTENDAIGCALEDAQKPLPVRITVTWNVATKQAKMYVGQSYTGLAGEGGIAKAVAKSVRILRVCGTPEIEFDADGKLPVAIALELMQRHLDADPTLMRFSAGYSGPPPTPSGSLPAAALPRVSGTRPVGLAGRGWSITLDPRTRLWRTQAPGDVPRLIPAPGLERWASRARRQSRSRNPRILIALPATAEWYDVLLAVHYLRQAGIADIAFVTAAPTAQPAR
jgi:hypothetical protein